MIITVSELTENLKKTLQTEYPVIFVKGELSNITHHTNGHLYFDLKDAKAKIGGVIFNVKLKNLSKKPKEGDSVIIEGSINIFASQGRYQLIVAKMNFTGLGELLLKFEEIKKKLSLLGWFDTSIKKKLPVYPENIGVVTSPTGAVIQDIVRILSRRCKHFHLILFPVKVQGEGSAKEIAEAIDFFNKYALVDVLIIGRGGGSIEDLWSFNEEIVAEAIFNSHIPVISAVGHEIDVTLSDFVADARAPTPSAAAVIVTKETKVWEEKLVNLKKSTVTTIDYKLSAKKEKLSRLRKELTSITFHYEIRQKLDFISERLLRNKKNFLKLFFLKLGNIQKNILLFSGISRHKSHFLLISKNVLQFFILQQTFLKKLSCNITNLQKQLIFSFQRIYSLETSLKNRKKELIMVILANLEEKRSCLQKYSHALETLNPKNVLKRGFSILLDFNSKSVILSKKTIKPKQKILAVMHDGDISLVAEESLILSRESNDKRQ